MVAFGEIDEFILNNHKLPNKFRNFLREVLTINVFRQHRDVSVGGWTLEFFRMLFEQSWDVVRFACLLS